VLLAAGALPGLGAAVATADDPAAPFFADDAAPADFGSVLGVAALPGNEFPPDGVGGAGGVPAFIKSLGTVTAGAADCGALSGELCGLCVGALTCATVTTDPFLPYDTTAKIITAATTAAPASAYPNFPPLFFGAG
jgi:hypothetical protein